MRIGLIGPLPPPPGGMANQTRQLASLLRSEGQNVELVRTNAPYNPRWVGNLRAIRALFRLLPYLGRLWRTAGRVDLFHVMANSGWSWHLFSAPAIWIGWLRRTPVVVNYRGGEAEVFFQKSFHWVRPTLKRVAAVIVPSGFLAGVFRSRDIDVHIVKNIVDIERFISVGRGLRQHTDAPHLLVTRNLEAIYDISTALRAFRRIHQTCPGSRLTVCGSGPEQKKLEMLARELALGSAVTFTGHLDNDRVAELYQTADVLINPSLADNMPISILEALACGVPVVSTNVGGVPYLLTHNKTALLVSPGDDQAMAEAVLSLLMNPDLGDSLVKAGYDAIHDYTWPSVRERLFAVYDSVLAGTVNENPRHQDVR
jgi:glycosyltransferase involved in cell wall biosynthesis